MSEPLEHPPLEHPQFVAAFREGRIRVEVDRQGAVRLMSARLLLPLVLLPLLGLGVGLALAGYLVAGIGIFVAALALRFLIRRSSPGLVLSGVLRDERFYRQAREAGLLRVRTTDHP